MTDVMQLTRGLRGFVEASTRSAGEGWVAPGRSRVLTLESNRAYGLNGVGYRKLGNARDVGPLPIEGWWDNDRLWTWAQMCERYRHRAQAVLRVKA